MGARKGSNNNGGPATDAGAARALANLQSPPDPMVATKHGLSAFLTRAIAPPCRFCVASAGCPDFREGDATCAAAEEYQAETAARIMALPQIRPEDAPLALEYAKISTALLIVDKYVAHASPFVGDPTQVVDVQPVLTTRARLSASLLKYADALGLTPLARLRLAAAAPKETGGFWAQAAAAAALEGEFTAEDPPPDQAGPDPPGRQLEF